MLVQNAWPIAACPQKRNKGACEQTGSSQLKPGCLENNLKWAIKQRQTACIFFLSLLPPIFTMHFIFNSSLGIVASQCGEWLSVVLNLNRKGGQVKKMSTQMQCTNVRMPSMNPGEGFARTEPAWLWCTPDNTALVVHKHTNQLLLLGNRQHKLCMCAHLAPGILWYFHIQSSHFRRKNNE